MQPPPQPRVHLRSWELDVLGGRGPGGMGREGEPVFFFLTPRNSDSARQGWELGTSAYEFQHWRDRIPLPPLVGRAP